MTNYSDNLTGEHIELLVTSLEKLAFESKRDGCRVALVKCAKCGREFEEEIRVARALIVGRLDFLCLACDPDASAPAFTGLTIQLGWQR